MPRRSMRAYRHSSLHLSIISILYIATLLHAYYTIYIKAALRAPDFFLLFNNLARRCGSWSPVCVVCCVAVFCFEQNQKCTYKKQRDRFGMVRARVSLFIISRRFFFLWDPMCALRDATMSHSLSPTHHTVNIWG